MQHNGQRVTRAIGIRDWIFFGFVYLSTVMVLIILATTTAIQYIAIRIPDAAVPLQDHHGRPRKSSRSNQISYRKGWKGILVCAPHAKGLGHMIIDGRLHDTQSGKLGQRRLHREVQKLSSDNYTKHCDRCDQHRIMPTESRAT